MDTQRMTIAQNCLNAAYDKTMAFPEIVGTLMKAGFEGYMVDYRRGTSTYFFPDGDNVELKNPLSEEPIAADFEAVGIANQVKWAQANPPEYSYSAFCKNVKAFGCAGYMVSFLGRRVVYFGRTAETHVEHFPQ